MDSPDRYPTEEEEKENQEKDIKAVKNSIWNGLFFFAGVMAGAWILALLLASAGTFTDTHFILPLPK
jgi:hypothetical protein